MRSTRFPSHGHVGYLIPTVAHYGVVCVECGDAMARHVRKTPIWRENIYPYSQHCLICKGLIVSPQTEAFPELFCGRDCSTPGCNRAPQ